MNMTKEEAIKILSTRDAHGVLCGYTGGYTEALDMAIEALSAEAEWIESRYVCTCSRCGYLVELKTPFCPNCGVKMKGEYK